MNSTEQKKYWEVAQNKTKVRSFQNENIRLDKQQVNIVKGVAFTVTATQQQIEYFLKQIGK